MHGDNIPRQDSLTRGECGRVLRTTFLLSTHRRLTGGRHAQPMRDRPPVLRAEGMKHRAKSLQLFTALAFTREELNHLDPPGVADRDTHLLASGATSRGTIDVRPLCLGQPYYPRYTFLTVSDGTSRSGHYSPWNPFPGKSKLCLPRLVHIASPTPVPPVCGVARGAGRERGAARGSLPALGLRDASSQLGWSGQRQLCGVKRITSHGRKSR